MVTEREFNSMARETRIPVGDETIKKTFYVVKPIVVPKDQSSVPSSRDNSIIKSRDTSTKRNMIPRTTEEKSKF